MVHHVGSGLECEAAIVYAVDEHGVKLTVFNVTGPHTLWGVTPEDQDRKRVGTWHWPERVEN
jgi:hypothetical protein